MQMQIQSKIMEHEEMMGSASRRLVRLRFQMAMRIKSYSREAAVDKLSPAFHITQRGTNTLIC